MPFFEGVDQEGKYLSSEMFSNTIVLIDFWYVACYPCQQALPIITKISKEYGKHVQVVGLNSIDSDREKVKEILARNNIVYPTLYTKRGIDSFYKISSYPTFILVDSNSIIRYVHSGFSNNLYQILKKEIDLLLLTRHNK